MRRPRSTPRMEPVQCEAARAIDLLVNHRERAPQPRKRGEKSRRERSGGAKLDKADLMLEKTCQPDKKTKLVYVLSMPDKWRRLHCARLMFPCPALPSASERPTKTARSATYKTLGTWSAKRTSHLGELHPPPRQNTLTYGWLRDGMNVA